MHVARVERRAELGLVGIGAPSRDPGEVLGHGQFGHVGDQPGRQRQLSQCARHPVRLVETRQRGARLRLALVECRAAQREGLLQRGRVRRQVGRQRNPMHLASRGRRVEFAHVLLRANGQQEGLALRLGRAVLLDHRGRHAERRRTGRQSIDTGAQHGAGLRHAVETRQRLGGPGAESCERVEFLALHAQRLELRHDRLGRAGPRMQGRERGMRRFRDRLLGIDLAQLRLRPPGAEPPRERFVLVQDRAQVLQRQLRAGPAVRLQLHRVRAGEAIERGAEFLARGQEFEPQRSAGTQHHAVTASAARMVIAPRSSCWASASSPRNATAATGESG